MLHTCLAAIVDFLKLCLLKSLVDVLSQIFKLVPRDRTALFTACAHAEVFTRPAQRRIFDTIIAFSFTAVLKSAKNQPAALGAKVAILLAVVGKFVLAKGFCSLVGSFGLGRNQNRSAVGFELLYLFDIRVARVGSSSLAAALQGVFGSGDLLVKLMAVIGLTDGIAVDNQTVFIIDYIVYGVAGVDSLPAVHAGTLRVNSVDTALFAIFSLGTTFGKLLQCGLNAAAQVVSLSQLFGHADQ